MRKEREKEMCGKRDPDEALKFIKSHEVSNEEKKSLRDTEFEFNMKKKSLRDTRNNEKEKNDFLIIL